MNKYTITQFNKCIRSAHSLVVSVSTLNVFFALRPSPLLYLLSRSYCLLAVLTHSIHRLVQIKIFNLMQWHATSYRVTPYRTLPLSSLNHHHRHKHPLKTILHGRRCYCSHVFRSVLVPSATYVPVLYTL